MVVNFFKLLSVKVKTSNTIYSGMKLDLKRQSLASIVLPLRLHLAPLTASILRLKRVVWCTVGRLRSACRSGHMPKLHETGQINRRQICTLPILQRFYIRFSSDHRSPVEMSKLT